MTQPQQTLAGAALEVNARMWAVLGAKAGHGKISFHAEQTPLIFDPMSTMMYGYASCTGSSSPLASAL